jgi:ElaB/YqjD/DUF883 family membrane-anchored ribosome-binding protein
MSSEQQLIQRQMERTRGSLTEKLEALETQVVDTVTSTADAVQDTTASVQETVTGAVDAVKETVAAVTDKVQETVQSVGDTFNLQKQMDRHPWLVLGGAVAVGCCVGTILGSSEERSPIASFAAEGSSPAPPPPPWSNQTRQAAHAAPAADEEPGVVGEALTHLKNLGVAYLMGVLRDLARKELPEMVANRVADEVDALTTKMGTQPISGPVLPEESSSPRTQDPNVWNRPGFQEKKESSYRGRAPVAATTH